MIMVGNLGAAVGNLVTGLILAEYTVDKEVQPNGYIVCFTMYAIIYGLGVLSWLLIDPTKPIIPADEPPHEGRAVEETL